MSHLPRPFRFVLYDSPLFCCCFPFPFVVPSFVLRDRNNKLEKLPFKAGSTANWKIKASENVINIVKHVPYYLLEETNLRERVILLFAIGDLPSNLHLFISFRLQKKKL